MSKAVTKTVKSEVVEVEEKIQGLFVEVAKGYKQITDAVKELNLILYEAYETNDTASIKYIKVLSDNTHKETGMEVFKNMKTLCNKVLAGASLQLDWMTLQPRGVISKINDNAKSAKEKIEELKNKQKKLKDEEKKLKDELHALGVKEEKVEVKAGTFDELMELITGIKKETPKGVEESKKDEEVTKDNTNKDSGVITQETNSKGEALKDAEDYQQSIKESYLKLLDLPKETLEDTLLSLNTEELKVISFSLQKLTNKALEVATEEV